MKPVVVGDVYVPLVSNRRTGSGGDDTVVGGQSATLPYGLGIAYALEGASGGAVWYGGLELKQQVWDRLRPMCWHNWSWRSELGRPWHTKMVWSLDPAHAHGPAAYQAQFVGGGRMETVLWGNEPDEAHQGNAAAAQAVPWVETWRAWYPGLWAFPGTIWRGGRDPWVDAFLDAGGHPPPVWQWHVYPADPAQTLDRVLDAMHEWMFDRGVARPVIVSEMCHRSNALHDQVRMLGEAVDALGDGRLQAGYWFAPHFGHVGWGAQDLVTETGALTVLGHYFVECVGRVRAQGR